MTERHTGVTLTFAARCVQIVVRRSRTRSPSSGSTWHPRVRRGDRQPVLVRRVSPGRRPRTRVEWVDRDAAARAQLLLSARSIGGFLSRDRSRRSAPRARAARRPDRRLTTLPNRYRTLHVTKRARSSSGRGSRSGASRCRRTAATCSDNRGRSRRSREPRCATLNGRPLRPRVRNVVAADDRRARRDRRASRWAPPLSGYSRHLRRHDRRRSAAPWGWPLRGLFDRVERWTIGRAARVNLVSRGFEGYFHRRYPGRAFGFVTNGIDEEFVRSRAKPHRGGGF